MPIAFLAPNKTAAIGPEKLSPGAISRKTLFFKYFLFNSASLRRWRSTLSPYSKGLFFRCFPKIYRQNLWRLMPNGKSDTSPPNNERNFICLIAIILEILKCNWNTSEIQACKFVGAASDKCLETDKQMFCSHRTLRKRVHSHCFSTDYSRIEVYKPTSILIQQCNTCISPKVTWPSSQGCYVKDSF